ncbi:hypothetical protein FEM48_Zijuj11G0135500 [Ziziphus jujuba var. spinosa]|uniref:DUF4220 domain-containing protein n=1 Tax=Ziziphus jujuba var. spinosa TaxID=714518 RepID=A0A978UJ81_ZIZJJ|nr:hypothetical protein FEM48_Zijuj11G0135500 [Ziziphus jujuba var. spinosa]
MVSFSEEKIYRHFKLRAPEVDEFSNFLASNIDYNVITEALCYPGTQWKLSRKREGGISSFQENTLNHFAKAWNKFICTNVLSVGHTLTLQGSLGLGFEFKEGETIPPPPPAYKGRKRYEEDFATFTDFQTRDKERRQAMDREYLQGFMHSEHSQFQATNGTKANDNRAEPIAHGIDFEYEREVGEIKQDIRGIKQWISTRPSFGDPCVQALSNQVKNLGMFSNTFAPFPSDPSQNVGPWVHENVNIEDSNAQQHLNQNDNLESPHFEHQSGNQGEDDNQEASNNEDDDQGIVSDEIMLVIKKLQARTKMKRIQKKVNARAQKMMSKMILTLLPPRSKLVLMTLMMLMSMMMMMMMMMMMGTSIMMTRGEEHLTPKPDNITSFALQDNKFWLRHLFALILQVIDAAYCFLLALTNNNNNNLLWLPIIIVLPPPPSLLRRRKSDIKSSYAHDEENTNFDDHLININNIVTNSESSSFDHMELLMVSHSLFKSFNSAISCSILSTELLESSKNFFLKSPPYVGFKLIEYKLSFMYEVLYTKAAAVLVVDLNKDDNDHEFGGFEMSVTYALLIGAIGVDIITGIKLIFSDWMIVYSGFERGMVDKIKVTLLSSSNKDDIKELESFIFKEVSKYHVDEFPMSFNTSRETNDLHYAKIVLQLHLANEIGYHQTEDDSRSYSED